MNKKAVKIAAVIVGVCAIILYLQNRLFVNLFLWGIGMETSGFVVKKATGVGFQPHNTESIEGERKDSIFILTRSKPDNVDKFIKDKQFLLTSLFEPATSPYPEAITNNISCPEELKPKRLSTTEGIVYLLYTGERMNYGVCARDLIKYRSAYGIFNCKKKGVFELKVFSSDQNIPKSIVKSFSCNAKL